MTKLRGLFSRLLKNRMARYDRSTPVPRPPKEKPTLAYALDEFADCADLKHRTYPNLHVDVLYFTHLVDAERLMDDVLNPLFHDLKNGDTSPQLANLKEIKECELLVDGILSGKAAVFYLDRVLLADVYGPPSRSIQQSETETVITGPHDAFVEQAETNLSLIRRRLKSCHLKVIKLSVGEISKADVFIIYIDGVANTAFVQTLIERIRAVEIDAVHDTNMLIQCIDDNPNSVFPQFLPTERPDAVASKLVSGRIVGMMEGSPTMFCAPTSFFEFFSSSDDYYQRWILGTATRALRFLAFVITVTFTAFYVAVTTYHYEMIPDSLLITISESRSRVPFPPLYEALLMETTIELLREAGARLPTKIGQTIGIVGGIVIGQAAVQAGFTSNILIIAVASSAIASFVIPSYIMSASIRLIRFGLIMLAGLAGNFGLMIGITATVIHLSGLTSLGASYLNPVAPFRLEDWKDVFIRAPFWSIKKRPTQPKPENKTRNKMVK